MQLLVLKYECAFLLECKLAELSEVTEKLETWNCLEFLSANVTSTSTWKPFQKLSSLMTFSFCQMTVSKTKMFHVDSYIVCEFSYHKTINTLREELLLDKRIDFMAAKKEKQEAKNFSFLPSHSTFFFFMSSVFYGILFLVLSNSFSFENLNY